MPLTVVPRNHGTLLPAAPHAKRTIAVAAGTSGRRAYTDPADLHRKIPCELPVVPPLLPRATPIHQVVQVDFFLPGCPPSADLIFYAVTELVAGRTPDLAGKYHFG